jgi:hypothetical protein
VDWAGMNIHVHVFYKYYLLIDTNLMTTNS